MRCCMIYDEPRLVWTSLTITLVNAGKSRDSVVVVWRSGTPGRVPQSAGTRSIVRRDAECHGANGRRCRSCAHVIVKDLIPKSRVAVHLFSKNEETERERTLLGTIYNGGLGRRPPRTCPI